MFMIFDFIFFSKFPEDSSLFTEKDQDISHDCVIGYFISNIHDTPSLAFFYQSTFLNNRRNRFCLVLESSVLTESIESKFTDQLIEVLGPILFNYQYFTLNGIPLINFINEINMQLIKTNIPLNLFIYKHESSGNDKNLKDWYLNFLESRSTAQQLIFFFTNASKSLTEIYTRLENAEEELKETNPYLFAILEQVANFTRQVENYEINIRGLQKEMESKEAYIDNLHVPETTMKKVTDFYYYEYEILPTWYKRLGHIIKVIIGKRTFRSLFNDNVKKYKD